MPLKEKINGDPKNQYTCCNNISLQHFFNGNHISVRSMDPKLGEFLAA